jgi:hypothetical protein
MPKIVTFLKGLELRVDLTPRVSVGRDQMGVLLQALTDLDHSRMTSFAVHADGKVLVTAAMRDDDTLAQWETWGTEQREKIERRIVEARGFPWPLDSEQIRRALVAQFGGEMPVRYKGKDPMTMIAGYITPEDYAAAAA